MARSWTRLHEHLGVPPGPLTFDMVAKAAADRLAESDDLDWKEHHPQPPREGRWNELAKDVAAMANTRGGLLIFGVRDTTCDLVGIDPDEVNIEQYAQWVRNHVQPYLSGLAFTVLTSADATRSVLVVDVPASPMAPHLVYGTAARDKDQQAAVAPYRDRDHTAWMAEHQLERAYGDRAARAAHSSEALQQLLDDVRQTVTLQQREASAWFIAAARPERPLPRAAARMTRQSARAVVLGACEHIAQQPGSRLAPGPLMSLGAVSNPRPGLRRWVLSTLAIGLGRESYAELHDDGTVVLAANLTWAPSRDIFRPGDLPGGLLVHQHTLEVCCLELCVLASQLARHLRLDSSLLLHATVTTEAHTAARLIPVAMDHPGFNYVPDGARYPHAIQPVTTSLLPADGDDIQNEGAQELFTDLTNQFGLDSPSG
ncbi:helix-turn-helix domain-containing protein [Streptomyces sp. NPDC004286]|uniref:AlbA family DNA-binding domain-containing protein n=1 Tax=Streptomyces sp. NPDC004286 TaxID=3364696 RepID=UPI00367A423B